MFEHRLDIIAENEPVFTPQDYKIKQKLSPKIPTGGDLLNIYISIDSNCILRFAQNL